ncbi:MAG: MASE4 domain-containing protein [Alphaproteobacteria bacterium]|nr:MASE4 domain-containing protein [Alphaproteobacteria bacterium]
MSDAKTMGAVLSAAAPSRREQMGALAVVALSALTLAALAPFARVMLPEVTAFIPAYQSALFITDLLTAVLLFGQFAGSRSMPVLVLASGYLFNALVIVIHTLSYPRVFTPNGLLGSGPQTTAWLFIIWHGGFVLFIIAYALMSNRERETQVRHVPTAIVVACLIVAAAVVAVVLLTTAGHDLLPVVMNGGNYSLLVDKGISPALCLLAVMGVMAMWPLRQRSVLDLWLLVVLSVWICDVMLSSIVGAHRYDLGFYAGRVYGLLATGALLVILLIEAHALQSKFLRSREALAQAQHFEAIGQLTGGVAHDFNNLLTVISGALEMIQRTPGDAAKVGHWARNGMTATTRGAALVQQLLTFSRRQVDRPETINVNKLLKEFEPLLRQAIGSTAEIAFDLSSVVEPVRVDPSQFEAAVLNLVINARDAMRAGGRILISTRNYDAASEDGNDLPAGSYVEIAVRDAGVGMSAETAARAITPFFTTKSMGSGSGLGLSQVYGFAKSAAGSLRIDSKVGDGTTVRIYLPKARGTSLSPLAERSVPLRPAPRTGHIVLVVEDEQVILDLATEGLTELGYRVIPAANAQEALDHLRAGDDIEIMFSDVVMPGGMNGVQLAVEARRIRPNLKVLLTSGYSHAALQERGIPKDVPLLAKPYRRDELAERLRAIS